MLLKNRAAKILNILKKRYPVVETPLFYETPFQLLVATILSAQCTDNQVNKVARVMYQHLKTPEDFSRVQIRTIEKFVRSTGFYRNKAKNIKSCSKVLLKRHGGQVPGTLDELVKLPGVGRKTANVVLGAVFDIPGMVVDTHVGRISQRLGLTAHKDPVKIEFDLMAVIPRGEWNEFSLRLIFFGREICSARKPKCPICPLLKLCPWPDKTT